MKRIVAIALALGICSFAFDPVAFGNGCGDCGVDKAALADCKGCVEAKSDSLKDKREEITCAVCGKVYRNGKEVKKNGGGGCNPGGGGGCCPGGGCRPPGMADCKGCVEAKSDSLKDKREEITCTICGKVYRNGKEVKKNGGGCCPGAGGGCAPGGGGGCCPGGGGGCCPPTQGNNEECKGCETAKAESSKECCKEVTCADCGKTYRNGKEKGDGDCCSRVL